MYEKVITLIVLIAGIASSIFFYNKGRRKGAAANIPSIGELEQRAEGDIRGAGEDNQRAADCNRRAADCNRRAADCNRRAEEQNQELRDNNRRAEELIKRGKEILGLGEDS